MAGSPSAAAARAAFWSVLDRLWARRCAGVRGSPAVADAEPCSAGQLNC